MSSVPKKLTTVLAPIFGAGAIGVCPLCWAGSASALTYLGLAGVIPYWRWIGFALIGLGIVGFILDYRSHGKPYPLIMLTMGVVLVQVGTNVFVGGDFPGWLIWGTGAVLVVAAIVYNKWLFRKPRDVKKVDLNMGRGTIISNEE
ncbi:MAG: MerC domain-containing protein [Chloroflexi bacterium]|nr:MerC domain-containing protein [Chloroflexota bacterium]MBI2980545.1 MerC domain-containing protein [Chloroflexota bacterium]